jgi:hypothetical protein
MLEAHILETEAEGRYCALSLKNISWKTLAALDFQYCFSVDKGV